MFDSLAGRAGTPIAATGRAPRAAAGPGVAVLALACVALCLGPMPLVYALVAFHGDFRPVMKPPVIEHVALNCAANLAVMLGALNLTGRLDQKLTSVFTRVLLAHGALAFLTLITRHFYSIPMLLTGIACSATLGPAVAFARHRGARPRVGVLGPWRPIVDDPRLDCRRIEPATPQSPNQAIPDLDLVLVTFDGDVPADWTPTLSRALLAGKRVRHIVEFLEEAQGAVALDHFDINDLPDRGSAGYRRLKRPLDLLFVAALAPLALPVIAAAALGVLFTMGRPILFIQPRVGLGGRVFRMFKLRSMRHDPAVLAAAATLPGDTRITPFGRLLRRLRIDELPQLWNVLRGDMSLIGPRPEWTALAERFTAQEPTYAFRHLVRPGITGWAQVKTGPAADLAETRVKLGYDLFYIKNLSFGLDLQILVRTLWTLIDGGGVR